MRFVVLLAALLAPAAARAQACPTTPVWPETEWTSREGEAKAARAAEIAELETFAFTTTGEDSERLGTRTNAVVIVRSGAVVYERYARGWDAGKPHLSWSVSKSFTNALTGIALRRGALGLEDSICDHAGVAVNCEITVGHLLEFSSGLDWAETYEGESNQHSSVLAMLYGEGRADMVRFIAGHPARDPPGETYAYSSGDTTLLAGVVGGALEPTQGEEFPWKLLFDPLGMTTVTWERDGRGVYVGSSYLYATPRDLARFGWFLLNDGCWKGQRLLPEGWVAFSTEVTGAFKREPLFRDDDDVQGRQFWLNRPVPEQDVETPWPDVPEDAFAARGHWGQSITVVPSLDLVIVRTADDRDGTFDFNAFVSLAIAVGRDL